ncbi:MAG: tRNA (guanosine(46)-N7)-methyltransferase TrmB [Planctomycetes bacterium]|nr:tRNA (guanosine(46)-N7)-methyltransferase TrmB [Planctomycetota bacterium]
MVSFDEIAVTAESLGDVVSFQTLFGNDAPVELEIGCGKGAFLLRRSRAHPELNFLGIEWANEFYKFAADRMARWGVTNVRIMRTDAKFFVMHRLPEACLAALHIYHPDPWPKKRHQKRRLLSNDFVDSVERCLVDNGRLAIQTDHAEYFEQIKIVTTNRPKLIPVDFADADYGVVGEDVETNFEIKYKREGRPIYRLAFRRAAR